MEILLLGTGAASGWPNPFCRCASCQWMRAHNDIRGQTSALVDDTLLIDCGPEAPRAAERFGHSLSEVRHILFTHAHSDHFGPAALMWREWAKPSTDIDVAGPPTVIAECRTWVGPGSRVRWHELSPGDVVELGDYQVRALPANHADATVGPALLYDVTGARSARFFWGTDTGPLAAEVLDALDGAAFDAVFLEATDGAKSEPAPGHLDLTSWASLVAELRRRHAVEAHTTLVPIHLGHDNPPPPRLGQLMASWGARLCRDGELIGLPAEPAPRPPLPRRVLVIGGARSGKSTWAESLLAAEPDAVYVATSRPDLDDPEWEKRIAVHRARRPACWQTLESLDLPSALAGGTPVLVECLTLWVGALMGEASFEERCDELVDAIATTNTTVVIVSNEVGSGVVPESESGRRFRDLLGRLNARVAAVSDEVWQVTAGIERRIA
jgi:adenosylcobinamide kinase/adenosylcobinamide-phosphate guanylyltransferase